MGKRILVQRKGRGAQAFRAPVHKRKGRAKYPQISDKTIIGTVIDILHDPGRGAPLMKVKFKDKTVLLIAPESIQIGQTIECGPDASLSIGNILPLYKIPEGYPIYNIESLPGDGGKYVRASGLYATIKTHAPDKSIVRLPSGQDRAFNPNVRAALGVVAGGGRPEKPFLKAGAKYHLSKTKAWKWPVVRGVAMNAVSHPHGGGSHQSPGQPSSVARNTPPGRKVGMIAPKRTGRKR